MMNWAFKSKTIAGVIVSLISAGSWLFRGDGIECSALQDLQSQLLGVLSMAGLILGPALSAWGRIDKERRSPEP